jgi:hypothetical protein
MMKRKPEPSISPSSGGPGTSVTVTGKGYEPGEEVNVTYTTGSTPSSLNVCCTAANSDGTFSCSGGIPTTDSGAMDNHKVQASGATSSARASATFTLS